MEHLLENPETWVLVAFLIFIALVAKKAYLVITVALDARATRIREGLDDAARLREEAQSLLAQYQRQQRGADGEIEAMLERARRDTALMLEAARTRLAAQLLQREKQTTQNIARAEAQMVDEVRVAASEMAMAAIEYMIIQNLNQSQATKLIDDSIGDLGMRLRQVS